MIAAIVVIQVQTAVMILWIWSFVSFILLIIKSTLSLLLDDAKIVLQLFSFKYVNNSINPFFRATPSSLILSAHIE